MLAALRVAVVFSFSNTSAAGTPTVTYVATPDLNLREQREHRIAVILAGHNGDAGTARGALASPDPTVRAAALSALNRIGVLSSSELVAGITDADFTVAARAADLSAQEPVNPETGNVDEALVSLLTNENTDLAEVAAWALGERHQRPEDTEQAIAPPDVLGALITTATDHADALVRESATAALGCIGDYASLPAILRACSDKATVRRRAVIALAAFEGPEVEAALEHARSDRDWQVRQAAEDLLA
jgi:HEAT repeat protein